MIKIKQEEGEFIAVLDYINQELVVKDKLVGAGSTQSEAINQLKKAVTDYIEKLKGIDFSLLVEEISDESG